jgi:hypothetical protein
MSATNIDDILDEVLVGVPLAFDGDAALRRKETNDALPKAIL